MSYCDICYKIICKQCRWEASGEELVLIQKKELTVCPRCSWSPQSEINEAESL